MKVYLHDVRTGFEGFQRIIELAGQIQLPGPGEYDVDMSGLGWLDANMCAPLGAILHKKQSEGTHITISSVARRPRAIMQKNHFLLQFGWDPMRDWHGTTIQYRRFEPTNRALKNEFQEYVNRHFQRGSKGLPNMTQELLRKLRESIFEIFENALEHSYTEHGVFACGQFYPRANRLDFSIADLGVGIRGNIERNLGKRLAPEYAIQWALSGNTTRRGRPGGLGLQLIQEFISLNEGRLILASDAGYWELSHGNVSTRLFSTPFPGTVVTMEINTADKKSYCLRSEIDRSNIF